MKKTEKGNTIKKKAIKNKASKNKAGRKEMKLCLRRNLNKHQLSQERGRPQVNHPIREKTTVRKSDEKDGKRKHHQTLVCPVCKNTNTNLPRHLRLHVRKGDIPEEHFQKVLSVAKHKGKRHGPPRVRKGEVATGLVRSPGLQRSILPITESSNSWATKIRRWLVTQCHEKKAAGAEFDETYVRRLMCHSDKTAKTFYLRDDMTTVAAKGVLILMQCTDPNFKGTPERLSTSPSVPQSLTTPPLSAATSTTTESTLPPLPLPAEQTEEAEPKRRALTPKQKKAICECFQNVIEGNDVVEINRVRERMRTNKTLRKLLTHSWMPQKVADAVRTRQASYKPPVETEEESETAKMKEKEVMEEEEVIEEELKEKAPRQPWTADDTMTIIQRFAREKVFPKKKRILEIFQDEEDLIPIFKSQGDDRCYHKVKNYFHNRK